MDAVGGFFSAGGEDGAVPAWRQLDLEHDYARLPSITDRCGAFRRLRILRHSGNIYGSVLTVVLDQSDDVRVWDVSQDNAELLYVYCNFAPQCLVDGPCYCGLGHCNRVTLFEAL